ncbi:MAG: Gfo/Idh/MocA family oxidoreductase [Kiritimatiellae bacterium]|nr:Gfo/Idh/MocA family oxidoreductase [Kiritimatiellia bacterium]
MPAIRTAIIGYGYAGRVMHAQLVRAARGLDLYAVSSRDPGRRQQAESDWGVKTYGSVADLLRDDAVDLCVMATPHDTHKPLSLQCLAAGKHVVTDKLMCMNAAEADEMIGAAQRSKRMLSVFHNRRWDCGYLTLKQAIADGLLGELLTVESTVVSWGHPSPDRWRSHKKHGGGSFRDWGAHLIDQALQLAGAPVTAIDCDMLYTEPGLDVETSARCTLRFEGGLRYTVETGCISALPRLRWYVRGTRGSFCKTGLDPQEDALRKGEVNAALAQPPEDRAEVRFETGGRRESRRLATRPGNWPAYYQNVADHLLKGEELAVKPEEIRRVMAVIDTAADSAEKGQVIACRI